MTVRVLACRRGASRARRVDMTGFCSYVVGGAAERQKVVYAVPPDSSNWCNVLVVILCPLSHTMTPSPYLIIQICTLLCGRLVMICVLHIDVACIYDVPRQAGGVSSVL